MADIVERLLLFAPVTNAETRTAMTEAAAEIERLRAALGKINVGEGWAALIARAALEGK